MEKLQCRLCGRILHAGEKGVEEASKHVMLEHPKHVMAFIASMMKLIREE